MKGLRTIRAACYATGRVLGWVIATFAFRLPARILNAIIGRGVGRLWR